MYISRREVVFDATSANSSTFTSSSYLVADYDNIGLSWATVGAGASRLTMQGSNDDGLTASITTWSTLTAITVQGAHIIEPGIRWVRALRSSLDSQAVVQLQLRS